MIINNLRVCNEPISTAIPEFIIDLRANIIIIFKAPFSFWKNKNNVDTINTSNKKLWKKLAKNKVNRNNHSNVSFFIVVFSNREFPLFIFNRTPPLILRINVLIIPYIYQLKYMSHEEEMLNVYNDVIIYNHSKFVNVILLDVVLYNLTFTAPPVPV